MHCQLEHCLLSVKFVCLSPSSDLPMLRSRWGCHVNMNAQVSEAISNLSLNCLFFTELIAELSTMEPSEGSDPRMDPNEGESKSRSSSRSSPNLPRKSPPYTGSILPQSMPTEGFSLPSGQYDSGSSRGHSPYEYSQPSYAQAPARDPMYSSYDLPETTARRPSGGILPASTEGFSSSLAGSGGAFSSLPPLESSGYYSPSPVYGYGSSTPGYSTAAYQDPYSQSSTMGSGSPYQHSYASGMSAESGYGMYPGGVPAYPYGQPYPDQYQRGRGYGPPGGRYGGQRRPRHNTSYASVPGPPIVQPGGAKGPDGANLFVFHIPNDFSNQEMYDMFAQYGNVLSARIMVEAETGRSRGFGFVSFDSTVSAAEAIKHLNGFPVSEACTVSSFALLLVSNIMLFLSMLYLDKRQAPEGSAQANQRQGEPIRAVLLLPSAAILRSIIANTAVCRPGRKCSRARRL